MIATDIVEGGLSGVSQQQNVHNPHSSLPGGRAPLPGTLEDRYKRLWRWASLSIGALLGNLEGFTCRDFLRDKDSISGLLS